MRVIQGIILIGTLFSVAEVRSETLAIIANKAYPSNTISENMTREIFLGEKTRVKFLRILPVDQEGSIIRQKFVEKILGIRKKEYDKYWFRKAFRDGIVPPVRRDSSQEVIHFVKSEAGAIGYVWRRESIGISGIKTLLLVEVEN